MYKDQGGLFLPFFTSVISLFYPPIFLYFFTSYFPHAFHSY
jgi:hypothetical protein